MADSTFVTLLTEFVRHRVEFTEREKEELVTRLQEADQAATTKFALFLIRQINEEAASARGFGRNLALREANAQTRTICRSAFNR